MASVMVHGPMMGAVRGFRMDPSITKQKVRPGTVKRMFGYAKPVPVARYE